MPHPNRDEGTERLIRKEALLLLAAWINFRNGVDREQLVTALRQRKLDAALEAVGLNRLDNMFTDVRKIIREAFERRVKRQAEEIGIVFDPLEPAIAAAISEQVDAQLRLVISSTRLAIERAFRYALEEGRGISEAADDVIAAIGLHPRQVDAVHRYRQQLERKAQLTAARIDTLVERYKGRLLRQRMDTIARSAIGDAESLARDLVYKEAARQGVMDPSDLVEWLTTSGNPCERCLEMEGNTRSIYGYYAAGLPTQDPPILHQNCACVENPVAAAKARKIAAQAPFKNLQFRGGAEGRKSARIGY